MAVVDKFTKKPRKQSLTTEMKAATDSPTKKRVAKVE